MFEFESFSWEMFDIKQRLHKKHLDKHASSLQILSLNRMLADGSIILVYSTIPLSTE
jgi:hypothetical protein